MVGTCITMSIDQVKKLCDEKKTRIDARRLWRRRMYATWERQGKWQTIRRFLRLPEQNEEILVEDYIRKHDIEVHCDRFKDDEDLVRVLKIQTMAEHAEQVLISCDDLNFLASE